jgi:surface protein
MNKNKIIIFLMMIILTLNIYAYNGDLCNETYPPCVVGGCTSTELGNMFQGVTDFNNVVGDITGWNTSCITNMESLFHQSDFNQDISNWDLSSLTTTDAMFYDTPFNQDISNWNMSSVTNMQMMFFNTPFNQDISNWDVSSVTNMMGLFFNTPFNQNIGGWDVSNVIQMSYMFSENYALSVNNYDAILLGWSGQSLQSGVEFNADNIQYTDITSHNILTNTYGWMITDAGIYTPPIIPECYSDLSNSPCQITDTQLVLDSGELFDKEIFFEGSYSSLVLGGVLYNPLLHINTYSSIFADNGNNYLSSGIIYLSENGVLNFNANFPSHNTHEANNGFIINIFENNNTNDNFRIVTSDIDGCGITTNWYHIPSETAITEGQDYIQGTDINNQFNTPFTYLSSNIAGQIGGDICFFAGQPSYVVTGVKHSFETAIEGVDYEVLNNATGIFIIRVISDISGVWSVDLQPQPLEYIYTSPCNTTITTNTSGVEVYFDYISYPESDLYIYYSPTQNFYVSGSGNHIINNSLILTGRYNVFIDETTDTGCYIDFCENNWIISEGECIGGNQINTYIDSNNCPVEYEKPEDYNTECEIPSTSETDKELWFLIFLTLVWIALCILGIYYIPLFFILSFIVACGISYYSYIYFDTIFLGLMTLIMTTFLLIVGIKIKK